jgi:hypothetical protein
MASKGRWMGLGLVREAAAVEVGRIILTEMDRV